MWCARRDARRRGGSDRARRPPAGGLEYGLRRPLWGALLCAVACSRTGLDGEELSLDGAASDVAPAPVPDVASTADAQPPPEPPEACVPQEEVCNGRDDDCNGIIDDVPPVPCPGGGERYCIAGRLSACPRRCEACIPGSERVCFLSYCTYWGVQTCASDGRSFGRCRERRAPEACLEIAREKQKSPELQQCCLDNGYCCLDAFDLDGDGDRQEMLGRCEEVLCGH